ncbi:alpha-hydroxy-acid oxidizing protein [Anaerotignum sp.]
MTYQEVLEHARKRMAPRCKVCPECNGIACKGVMPGPAGKGSSRTFQRNFAWLAEHVWLEMDVTGGNQERNMKIELFGKEFEAPIFVAPMGLIPYAYTEDMTDKLYCDAVMAGAKAAGILAFGGGGPKPENFYEPLEAIKENNGWGIPTLKPWSVEVVKERLKEVEAVNPIAFAMDIDSAGLPHAGLANPPMMLKTEGELKEIAAATKLPFVVKGIMTAEAAEKAVRAGAYAIVVSNHGGRVMDHGLSTAEVLPEIKEAVGDRVKVFADGGVRTGDDVFKMLALGADAVLIGRPYVIAAYGGGAEGVALYTEKLKAELRDAMTMTNCATLADINKDKIRII